jgi:hypothetical protein
MGVRRHLVVDKPAHLGAHLLKGGVEPAVADGERALRLAHEFDQSGTRCGRVAVLHEPSRTTAIERRGVFVGEAEVGKPGELLLVHGDAAGDLAEIFAERDLHQKLLGFAETSRLLQPLGVACKASQGLGIGGKPGKRVQPVLLGIDGVSHDAPVGRDIARDRGAGLGKTSSTAARASPTAPSRPSITAGRLPMVSAKLISRLRFSICRSPRKRDVCVTFRLTSSRLTRGPTRQTSQFRRWMLGSSPSKSKRETQVLLQTSRESGDPAGHGNISGSARGRAVARSRL